MKKLKVLRRDSGLTQQDLSAASGVVRWRIAHAEVGLIRLTSEELDSIRAALVTACEKRSARVMRLRGEAEAVAV
jgi:predicted transcriptional regulator